MRNSQNLKKSHIHTHDANFTTACEFHDSMRIFRIRQKGIFTHTMRISSHHPTKRHIYTEDANLITTCDFASIRQKGIYVNTRCKFHRSMRISAKHANFTASDKKAYLYTRISQDANFITYKLISSGNFYRFDSPKLRCLVHSDAEMEMRMLEPLGLEVHNTHQKQLLE